MVKIGNDSDEWKMLRITPEINEVVFKLKGWHLQRGKKVTNSDVVTELILKDAKRKGIQLPAKWREGSGGG